MDVLRLVVAERHFVDAEKGRLLAVRVVLPRSATVVAYVGIVGGQAHTHTEFRHDGLVGTCRLVVYFDQDAAFAEGSVFHCDIGGILPNGGAAGESGSVLVVVLGFPEIRFKGCLQYLTAVNNPRREGITFNSDARGGHFLCRNGGSGELVGLEHKLLAGNSKAFLGPGLVLLQPGFDIEHRLAVISQRVVADVVFVEGGELVTVDETDVIAFADEGNGLVDLLHLVVVGMRLAVGRDEAVDAERPVVRLVAEVAAVEESPLQTSPRRGGIQPQCSPPFGGGGGGEA